jgi:nuclear factor I
VKIKNNIVKKVSNLFQLFSYPSLSPVSGMSGVISPTNLSLFSSPIVGSPRTSSRGGLPRWTPPGPTAPPPPPPGPGPPFITLEEDYMMTPLISTSNNEANSLIDDGKR